MNRVLPLPWPRGLKSQIVAVAVMALIVSEIGSAFLAIVLQPHQRPPSPDDIAGHVGLAIRVLDSSAPAERPALAAALAGGDVAISLLGPGPVGSMSGDPFASAIVRAVGRRDLAIATPDLPPGPPHFAPFRVTARFHDGERAALDITLRGPPGFLPLGVGRFLISLPFLAASIALLTVWATRRVTAPLEAFADAAERMGQEQSAPLLPETGSFEVQRAARAFNRMQGRLRKFIDDRTRMLAAISHDLRTPITRLRLRVEAVVENPDDQMKMLQDLQRMDAMIGSALAFLRDDGREEATEIVDVASLLLSICDDFADMAYAVDYAGPASAPLQCRPRLLNRAVTNLIENAVKYASHVTVDIGRIEGAMIIVVEDDGPGIADSDKALALEPFRRLDAARRVDTGGVGLGLSIARSIAEAHGGTLDLTDSYPHGLRAALVLPLRL